MTSGFFLMQRGWQDDPVFGGRRDVFSRRDSWAWLVENVRWQDGQVMIGGKLIDVKRGQLCCSISFLADAWKWDDSKVRRWLVALSSVKKIVTSAAPNSTILTVCNYDEIQAPATNDRRTIDEPPTSQRRASDDNYKEGKEGKEGNQGNLEPDELAQPRVVRLETKRKCRLDPGWQPTPKGFDVAREVGMRDVDEQILQFRDYHAAKGNVMVDWDAAWRNWCRNSIQFSRRSTVPLARKSKLSWMTEDREMLNVVPANMFGD